MAQLFPRWANTAVRAAIVFGAAGLGAAPVALLAFARSPTATGQYRHVTQPVPFSHPVHVNAMHIDCRYCHAGAERAAMAGIAPTKACVECHEPKWIKSRQFAPVRLSLSRSTPIPWRRVNSIADFVFFNHAAHTRKGIGCETCHGRVDLMNQVYQTAPLTMGWCIACHTAPEKSIRPVNQITAMGWTPPREVDQDSLGRALVAQYHVRSVTTCTGCHR